MSVACRHSSRSRHFAHCTRLPACQPRGLHTGETVQAVRNATAQFTNVNAATAAGYQPLFGCVSGPDQGAMGVHYINLSLYGDGKLDETRPEALIYEPFER